MYSRSPESAGRRSRAGRRSHAGGSEVRMKTGNEPRAVVQHHEHHKQTHKHFGTVDRRTSSRLQTGSASALRTQQEVKLLVADVPAWIRSGGWRNRGGEPASPRPGRERRRLSFLPAGFSRLRLSDVEWTDSKNDLRHARLSPLTCLTYTRTWRPETATGSDIVWTTLEAFNAETGVLTAHLFPAAIKKLN